MPMVTISTLMLLFVLAFVVAFALAFVVGLPIFMYREYRKQKREAAAGVAGQD